jgi:RNA ligase
MNHEFDLNELESLFNQGYLKKSETKDLVLYGYTDVCVYDKNWNKHTRAARGLIFEKSTGNIIARPFSKFFNLGEMDETRVENLPNLPYNVYEKVDGSLGIVYWYNDRWNVSTRGNLNSHQAQKAEELLQKYDFSVANEEYTYLVEIIYQSNKIIVDYGQVEQLILLGAINTKTGEETFIDEFEQLGNYLEIPIAKTFNLSIEEMISLQKTIPKDNEGFVVRYSNGLRVKIKGEEYLRIARLMSTMSPLALWETMKDGKVDLKYLYQLPEEFQKEYLPVVDQLERQYLSTFNDILNEKTLLPVTSAETKEEKKALGLFLQDINCTLKHKSVIFNLMLNKKESVEKYVLNQIRPTANNLINKEIL